MEAGLVQREQVPYTSIPAAGVHGVGLRALPGNLLRLARGTLAARRVIRQFQPDALLFTGGYVAVPVAVAGRRSPSLVSVPDIEPGLALKTIARFADRIAVTTPDSRAFFPGDQRVTVSGYPLRPGLVPLPKEEALSRLGFQSDLPVVLVTGGSKGARSINLAVAAALPELLKYAQVLHLTGLVTWGETQASLPELPAALKARYQAMPYLHDMQLAYSAADLVVSRAGASILGEYPRFGLPSVLVPYPYAWRYQKTNAEYLVSRGAALLLEDGQMAEQLLPTVLGLLQNPQRLAEMRSAMSDLAQPQAAENLAGILVELAQSSSQKAKTASW